MIAIDPYDMEWYTPPEILNSVYEVLSTITLDPCSPVIPTVEAQTYYTVEDNGLVLPWFGNVFMNPPYGRDIPQWVNKFIKEWTIVSEGGGRSIQNAVLLVPVKTDTRWWDDLMGYVSCWCTIKGRVQFISPNENGKVGKHTGTFASALLLFSNSEEIRYVFNKTMSNLGRVWVEIN